MAKIRAYKLAEELGIERNEFVEKAGEHGVELKSPMASLDEAQVDLLREKLGKKPSGAMVERRVESKGGRAIIRRRKRAEAPPPEEEPAPEEPAPIAEEEVPAVAEAEAEPAVAELEPEPAPIDEPAEEPAVAAAADEQKPAVASPTTDVASTPAPTAKRTEDAPAPPGAAKQRKRVREVVNLLEQEKIARQATGRAAPRRPVQVDPRAFASPRRKRRDAPSAKPKVAKAAPPKPAKRSIRVEGETSVGEVARLLGAKAAEVQGKLMALGTMASINQLIDLETITKIADEYGFTVQDVGFNEAEALGAAAEPVDEAKLKGRPPVVTVMGHVDHGKTSLLDAIRRANVVEGEAGGITQHIGAYQIVHNDQRITFIDTPGHAAFTQMRARGAEVTDIVILVVAANDGVMPQTIEAINHAKAANVPIIVAVNKCDLPDANSQTVRQRLMEHELVSEEFGGDTICVDISATRGTGLDSLLEMLNLQSEVLELKADEARPAAGVVLESRLDKGRGPVASVLVNAGTLKRGDIVVAGTSFGRVRAIEDENSHRLKEAGPSTPVQLIGLADVPAAGDEFHVVESERAAKEIVGHRQDKARGAAGGPARPRVSLDDLFAQAEGGGVKELGLVLKADVHGSVEALKDALLKLSTDRVKVNVVHSGVGAISENDVMLAKAGGAIVVGFHVRPDPAARRAAESQAVDIRTYQIIYEATDEIRNAMAGLLPPTIKESNLGRAEVRETFNVPRIGTIAGCYVTEGTVRRNGLCRLIRDGVQIFEGSVGSLKRFKDDVREVANGFECGIGLEGYNDVKIGDVIETYVREEQAASLE